MYNRPRQSFLTKLLDSKFFLVASLAILILVSFALFKIVYQRIQIKKEVNSLEEKIQTLEKNNLDLAHLIDYLNTDSFKEESARKELDLKKPEEKVVVITKKDKPPKEENIENPENNKSLISNPQKWWQYFFE